MGGQNHQPCRIYLAESTRLSRFLSLGRAELELGNVALEDLILAELDGQIGEIATIISHLEISKQALAGAADMVGKIRQKMYNNNFADMPNLRKLILGTLRTSFIAKSLVDADSWNTITCRMLRGGF